MESTTLVALNILVWALVFGSFIYFNVMRARNHTRSRADSSMPERRRLYVMYGKTYCATISIVAAVAFLPVALTDDYSVLPAYVTIPLAILAGIGFIVTAMQPRTEFKQRRTLWRGLARFVWAGFGILFIISAILALFH